ncbi:class I SAM-dependent methyltransferase [Sphingomonas sp.]|uniref:class I SAM-dependent methyltransferase n=1 Tax=Sphingomonas sp. TaxID=28214 RepID=UPI002FCA818B
MTQPPSDPDHGRAGLFRLFAGDAGPAREPIHVTNAALPELPPNAFSRIDESDDVVFYAPPRLVTHIDAGAIAALSDFYRSIVPKDGVVLDLMSSWVSHLPEDLPLAEVIGHGMNAQELAANPRLTRWFVQDLNRDPILPLPDGGCDAALCCVSVQYLQRPVEVFGDVRRLLRPGAPFVVSFSNRTFPTKSVAVWRSLDLQGRAALLRLYFERAGFSSVMAHVLADGRQGDPLIAVVGRV